MTQTAGETKPLLVDTSVAVALLVADHASHGDVMDAIAGETLGLSGHAAYETYSVLTRLPVPARRTPATAARVLRANFPASKFLPEEESARLLTRLPDSGIAGGAVYDALVGAAAAYHGSVLATRDRRAAETYRAVGVSVRLL